jgi:hypothetical protein
MEEAKAKLQKAVAGMETATGDIRAAITALQMYMTEAERLETGPDIQRRLMLAVTDAERPGMWIGRALDALTVFENKKKGVERAAKERAELEQRAQAVREAEHAERLAFCRAKLKHITPMYIVEGITVLAYRGKYITVCTDCTDAHPPPRCNKSAADL